MAASVWGRSSSVDGARQGFERNGLGRVVPLSRGLRERRGDWLRRCRQAGLTHCAGAWVAFPCNARRQPRLALPQWSRCWMSPSVVVRARGTVVNGPRAQGDQGPASKTFKMHRSPPLRTRRSLRRQLAAADVPSRATAILERIARARPHSKCLDGSPHHPLHLRADVPSRSSGRARCLPKPCAGERCVPPSRQPSTHRLFFVSSRSRGRAPLGGGMQQLA